MSEFSKNDLKIISLAYSIGPKMVRWINQCGYRSLDELANEEPMDIAMRIEIETGTRLNANGTKALANLIEHLRTLGYGDDD